MNDDDGDNMEIDGAEMAAEIASHNAANPAPVASFDPPVEEEAAAPVEVEAPVSAQPATPDASVSALQQALAQSQEVNLRMLAALERIGQPAAPVAAQPDSADPFAGLDPNDPDDKIEILNIKLAQHAQQQADFEQRVYAQQESARSQHASVMNSAKLQHAVEATASRMGITDNATKSAMFETASAGWRQHGFNPAAFAAAESVLLGHEAIYKAGRNAAVRSVATANGRQPVAPVRGAPAGTTQPSPSAIDKQWESADIRDVDEMTDLFRQDFAQRH